LGRMSRSRPLQLPGMESSSSSWQANPSEARFSSLSQRFVAVDDPGPASHVRERSTSSSPALIAGTTATARSPEPRGRASDLTSRFPSSPTPSRHWCRLAGELHARGWADAHQYAGCEIADCQGGARRSCACAAYRTPRRLTGSTERVSTRPLPPVAREKSRSSRLRHSFIFATPRQSVRLLPSPARRLRGRSSGSTLSTGRASHAHS
jgi:hypothetical protein